MRSGRGGLIKDICGYLPLLEADGFSLLTACGLIVVRRFIYETEHHNGIAELLEILGR